MKIRFIASVFAFSMVANSSRLNKTIMKLCVSAFNPEAQIKSTIKAA